MGAADENFNQPPPLENFNAFTGDPVLCAAVQREGGGAALESLTDFGALTGSAEVVKLGRLANEHPPTLEAWNRRGEHRDVVEYHPSYHALMEMSFAQGLNGSPWEHVPSGGVPTAGAVVARQAGSYLMAQAESGHCCPVTMTNAAVPVLMQGDMASEWIPKMIARQYDPSFCPAAEKTSVSIGMGMTEKQGGTDVRANVTRAEKSSDGWFRLTGHKWFFSAPMSDAFLVLAQAEGGLSCFFLPRFTPDGNVNAIRLLRLKDKVGNRSNASAEVEFDGALARLVGEEGGGIKAIVEMVTQTRLDCAVCSAGLMRQAVVRALHHCSYRQVFKKRLIDQPLMMQVLADLVVEWEAAVLLCFRLARAFDEAHGDSSAAAWRRLMTPVAKYWICKRGPSVACEAMECLGGNGYVEENFMGRLYREMPVNGIWEGSGNVMCLDVLRVLDREPEALAVVLAEAESVGDSRVSAGVSRLKALVGDVDAREAPRREANARRIVELLARTVMGGLMVSHGGSESSGVFCATRLGDDGGWTFGLLPTGTDSRAVIRSAGDW